MICFLLLDEVLVLLRLRDLGRDVVLEVTLGVLNIIIRLATLRAVLEVTLGVLNIIIRLVTLRVVLEVTLGVLNNIIRLVIFFSIPNKYEGGKDLRS